MDRLPPAVRLLGIGWDFALCIALGIGGGVWLGGWVGISPLFLLLGLSLGLAAAFYGGFRMLMEALAGDRDKGRGGP